MLARFASFVFVSLTTTWCLMPSEVLAIDCNNNGTDDSIDISSGTSWDCYPSDGVPDECQDPYPVINGDWATGNETGWIGFSNSGDVIRDVALTGPTPPCAEIGFIFDGDVGYAGWYQRVTVPMGEVTLHADWLGFLTTGDVADILLIKDTKNMSEIDLLDQVAAGNAPDIAYRRQVVYPDASDNWDWEPASGSVHGGGNGGTVESTDGEVVVALRLESADNTVPPGIRWDNIRLSFGSSAPSPDCNQNGFWDALEIAWDTGLDCNSNCSLDECDIGSTSQDVNDNNIPDECEPDCNNNSIPDEYDIAIHFSADCNGNNMPDECELYNNDCNDNGALDECEIGKPGIRFLDPDQRAVIPNFNGFPADAFTVSLWIRSNDPREAAMFSYATSLYDNTVLVYNPHNLTLQIGEWAAASGVWIADGRWYHVAWTWRGSDGYVTLYVDGQEIGGCRLVMGTLPDGGTLVLGDDQDFVGGGYDPNQAFIGDLAEIRLWDYERAWDEVYSEWATPLTGSEPGLVGYWRFDEGAGDVAADATSNGNNATLENGPSWLANRDCNNNGILDDCELDGNDCNVNGIPDDCELQADCNNNQIPDICELDGNDCNNNGIPDDCDVSPGREVVQWGDASQGQQTPPTEYDFIDISGGGYHSVALHTDGSIYAWGADFCHQVSDAPATNGFIQVSADGDHNFALHQDGTITGWGQDAYDQITDIPQENSFVAVKAGSAHGLALRADGSLIAWGRNLEGQTNVPAGNDFIAIAAGSMHCLALREDGTIEAWGTNGWGQLDVPTGMDDFVAIAACGYHSLAIREDGSLVRWGDNRYGLDQPPAGNDFVAIDSGAYYNLARRADGSLVAWGSNNSGQTSVPSGYDYQAVAAGWYHSLALKMPAERSYDLDTDGVPDECDLCLNTIPGATVGADGCPDPPIPNDYDNDGDVDQYDYATFEACASGPAVPLTAGCEEKDRDSDGDVDQEDFAQFQRCYSGENNPGDPTCAD